MKMRPYTQETEVEAYLDVIDNSLSIRKAVEKHGMNHQTLSNRLRGILARREVVQSNQRLSLC